MRVAGANAATLSAVDRDADKVGLGECCLCKVSLRWRFLSLSIRCGRLTPLRMGGVGTGCRRRGSSENLGYITVWTCTGVFEDDVCERNGAKVTTGAGVCHPRRRGIFW